MRGIGALELDDVIGYIYINGLPHSIFTTYHDSNEEPESSCTNRMISFLIKDRIYQYRVFLHKGTKRDIDFLRIPL